MDIPNGSYEVLLTAGKRGSKTTGDPGTVAAANIRFDEPGKTKNRHINQNLWVSSSTILATSKNGAIQYIDEDSLPTEYGGTCTKPLPSVNFDAIPKEKPEQFDEETFLNTMKEKGIEL